MTTGWDTSSAISLYNIDRWGTGYFSINDRGNIEILPTQNGVSIDMMEVLADAKEQGLTFPLVLRFQDLLRHRVEKINGVFADAIKEANYQNVYRGVFPIKVNQLREVVEEIDRRRAAVSFRNRGRQQAGTDRGARDAQRPGKPDYLQRLQGRHFHQKRAARPQAREKSLHGGGETRGAARDPRGVARGRRGAADRPPCAAAKQGRGQVGDQRRRKREVRFEHRGSASSRAKR